MKALVLALDAADRARLGAVLLALGFEVGGAADAQAALAAASRSLPDLVLSVEPAAELLRPIPGRRVVCVLDCRAGAEALLALDRGADAVVARRASDALLRAVVRSLLRRGWGIRFDAGRRVVAFERGVVTLSPLEYALLARLARPPGELRERRALLTELWSARTAPASPKRALDAHAARLRCKLRPHGWTLTTVRGVGYRLEPLAA